MAKSATRELELDTRVLEPWEIGARLHMLLIAPGASEKRMRDLVTSACADQIRISIKDNPERRNDLLARHPAYRPSASRTQMKNAKSNLEHAQRLGLAVLVMIKEVATGELPVIDGLARQPSMAFLARSIWPRHPGEPEDNYHERVRMIQRRKIRECFSVAHLAAALQWLAREADAAGAAMTFDYQDLEFHRRWVALAGEFADHIRATPALENLSSELIELVWVEDDQLSAPPCAV